MANPPEFDLQSGTYREAQNLKLIGNAAGTIYFTTDGSVPDENSQVYTSPIPLKDGGYEIKALFVNHYGIASDISSANYYIDISRPDAPYVTPLPGNYDKPVRIEVDVPDTPIPISDRLSSSLESNRKTCLFSRNASLELALMIMERTVSPAPLIHLLYCLTAG